MVAPTESEITRFSAYLDDELSPDERAAFEDELDRKPALQEAFDQFVGTLDAFSGFDDVPEIDLREGVERKLRRRSRGRFYSDHSLHRQRMQTGVFVAAAFVVLGAISLVANPGTVGELWLDDPLASATDSEATAGAHDGERRASTAPPTPIRSGDFSHRTRAFTIHATIGAEALDAWLAERTQADARSLDGDARVLEVPRAEVVTMVESLAELGPVSHEEVEIAPGQPHTTIRIVPAHESNDPDAASTERPTP